MQQAVQVPENGALRRYRQMWYWAAFVGKRAAIFKVASVGVLNPEILRFFTPESAGVNDVSSEVNTQTCMFGDVWIPHQHSPFVRDAFPKCLWSAFRGH